MNHRPARARAVPHWLADAADDPGAVRALWRAHPGRSVVLATGRTFDALTVDLRTGMEAMDLLRHRTRPALFPSVADSGHDRMRLLLPRGARARLDEFLDEGPRADRPPHDPDRPPHDRDPLRGFEYHSEGSGISVPGPATATGGRVAWAVRPTTPVDHLHALLGPLVTALATARTTVAWCGTDIWGTAAARMV